MNMRKSTLLLIAAVLLGLFSTACSGNNSKNDETAAEQTTSISVDELMADAESLVGDTVTIEGVCSHLCKHGGRKAFVVGSNDSLLIRCEAFPLMGECFSRESVHKPIEVTGVLREQRIDEQAIVEMEQQHEAQLKNIENSKGENASKEAAEQQSGCDTERAAQGQQNVTSFDERMADYRAKIAARMEKEGKDYLSYYYIDAISYRTLPE